ncbi:DUF6931 family protein [Paracoccus tegillarcae]|uniref:DUF6931 family protein n=1 Tax=Paracoccus tegillarcae TaxID=1529068 RepID=UPI0018E6CCED|nr:hypothetical protein [Paracoccus tegillarcae]
MNDSIPPPTRSDADKTRPPVGALRFDTPQDLYLRLPEIAELTQQRPRPGEDPLAFLGRLRSSTTPEEAVTYTAFAALPQMTVRWGYECLRLMADYLDPMERPMMEMVAAWLNHPSTAMRQRIAREALWAPSRSPSVFLGLAVAWSGGAVAPNDPMPVPLYRSPRAVNSAVLSCLARAELQRRPIYLARFIDMAETLFRVY